MKNELKIQREKLIEKAFTSNQELLKSAKAFILKSGIIMLAFRILFVIIETIYTIYANLPLTTVIFNYFLLFIGVMFVIGIYNGVKELAYLAIMGGIISITNLFTIGHQFNSGNTMYNIYLTAFIVGMSVQIIVMMVILLNKTCKEYFLIMKDINKELTKKK